MNKIQILSIGYNLFIQLIMEHGLGKFKLSIFVDIVVGVIVLLKLLK